MTPTVPGYYWATWTDLGEETPEEVVVRVQPGVRDGDALVVLHGGGFHPLDGFRFLSGPLGRDEDDGRLRVASPARLRRASSDADTLNIELRGRETIQAFLRLVGQAGVRKGAR